MLVYVWRTLNYSMTAALPQTNVVNIFSLLVLYRTQPKSGILMTRGLLSCCTSSSVSSSAVGICTASGASYLKNGFMVTWHSVC